MASLLDMGIGSVHVPTAIGNDKPMANPDLTVSAKRRKKTRNKKKTSSRTFSRGLRMTTTHPDGSRTTIHHMSAFFSEGTEEEGPKILLSLPLDKVQALSAGDENKRVWIQVAKAGRFVKDGKPFELNARVFDEICTNFTTQGFGRIQYDFEHASEMRPTEGSVPLLGTPSQGWSYGFKHDGQRLFALTDWGDLAREYIRNDQYQGVSPAIRWNQRDRVSGKPIGAVISSIAITNSPFLSGMEPLAASIGADAAATYCSVTLEEPEPTALSGMVGCYSASEMLPRIKSALRLHDLATPTQMSDMLGNLREHMDAADGDHTQTVNGVRLQDYALPLRSVVNAHAGMSWDEVFDVVEDLIDVSMDEHIIEDHGGDAVDAAAPSLNSSAEVSAASNLSIQGGPQMATVKTPEQYELELTVLAGEKNQLLADIEALKATNVTLSTKIEEHETQLLNARVDVAFDTYREKKGLPADGKPSLLSYLRADPTGFEKLFPNLPAPQRHLLTVHTADGRNQGQSVQLRAQADSPSEVPSLKPEQMVARIMKETGCTLLDAQCQVDSMITKMRRAG